VLWTVSEANTHFDCSRDTLSCFDSFLEGIEIRKLGIISTSTVL
jgi:hypothetical protein